MAQEFDFTDLKNSENFCNASAKLPNKSIISLEQVELDASLHELKSRKSKLQSKTESKRIIIDTNTYLFSLPAIMLLKHPITVPLAVAMELQGLCLNPRTQPQAQMALDWIQSKPSNIQLVTHTGTKVKEIMSESWSGRVDDLILDLAVGNILVTADVNLRILARTRGVRVVESLNLLHI